MAKKSEPNRSSKYDPSKPHITESPITSANWYKHVNWLNVTLIVGIPLYGLIQAIWTPLRWQTALFAVVYYFMSGLGITAGECEAPIQTFSANMLQDIIDFGHIPHTRPPFL
jgi:stearoyl-CoA desaturase (delta-9 desaturase)